MDTKPLILYYGAAAFAKVLLLASSPGRPADLSQSHGLSCFVGDGDLIANFSVRAQEGRGLFQEFNDAVAARNRLHYFLGSAPREHICPTARSDALSTLRIRLIDIFARIPDVSKEYRLSVGSDPASLGFHFNHQGDDDYTIRVDVADPFNNAADLGPVVETVRARAPFLRSWNLARAESAWGKTVLTFANARPHPNELLVALDQFQGYGERIVLPTFSPFDMLPPLSEASPGYSYYVDPIGGEYLSRLSLMLAALLALSSLVRYHPHSWTACIHRRRIGNRPVDDSLLPVIEAFLGSVSSQIPAFIANELMREPP